MDIEQCRKSHVPHNRRYRTTLGYFCEDCQNFFPKDSEEYIRTEGISNIYFAVWNVRADFLQKGIDVPVSISSVLKKINYHEEKNPFSMPFNVVKKLIEDAKAVINEYTEFREDLYSISIGEQYE